MIFSKSGIIMKSVKKKWKAPFSVSLLIFSLVTVIPLIVYGKPKLPAEIGIEFSNSAKPNIENGLTVTAKSMIPFKEGRIILTIPAIGSTPLQEVLLWSGDSDETFAQSLEYILPLLPVGNFRLRATFEFSPLARIEGKMGVSKNLYIEVRPDKILSSDISFRQIKRKDLAKEVEERGLLNKSEDEIKRAAPDLYKKIRELNRQESIEESSTKGEQ